MSTTPRPAHPAIAAQQAQARAELPFADTQDFDDGARGLIGQLEPCVIRADDDHLVWDNDSYAFLAGDAPDTVHPSLWRQAQLVTLQGLYEVVEGIYQVRGLDISNVTFVEGDTGVLVIDPLLCAETAEAAFELYRKHRGDRPVTGVIYTHSHVDHFGGVRGIVTDEDVSSGRVPVIAPEGFVEHTIKENVYAGTAMARRGAYMYGAALARGPQGQVSAGLGATASTGTITLIPPTVDITETGQEEVIDGIRIVFQMAPGTEAPAEMHFYFPDFKALCLAENATHNLHNLITLRGAVVRDPHMWSRYLTEAIDLFCGDVEVAFASHHWPTWGHDRIVEYLSVQRDLYGYLHDQTLRMMNKGMVGPEIAEEMQVPPALEQAWHTHGYYGSVSHNVKGIYQRYLGWFDGNPAHLWEHPPVAKAMRYVEFMGGADAVVERARTSYEEGDFRWVAEVLNHVVFAEPGHEAARELLADTYEQLGYGAENGTWRNFYLSGTTELRSGGFGTPTTTASADLLAQLTPEMLFDALAIRVDGPRAWDERILIDVRITDTDTTYRLRLVNGVLTYTASEQAEPAELTLSLPSSSLLVLMGGDAASFAAAGVEATGDLSVLARLTGLLEAPDPDFAIVTPD